MPSDRREEMITSRSPQLRYPAGREAKFLSLIFNFADTIARMDDGRIVNVESARRNGDRAG